MTRQSAPRRTAYSASNVLAALADDLIGIKRADKLTFADMGAVLGKSGDQAAKYSDGSATMDVVTFGRGRREWGSRFTAGFDLLCDERHAGGGGDQAALTALLQLVVEISRALEDQQVCGEDAEAMRVQLLDARAAIDRLLAKIPTGGEKS